MNVIRTFRPEDLQGIVAIYNHYILHSVATFETSTISKNLMEKRVGEVTRKNHPWLVMEGPQGIIGYAYASEWKKRSAYQKTVETSIYLYPDAVGNGHGQTLYKELINRLVKLRVHAIIGGVSLPNAPSKRMHENLGFEHIGTFSEVGYKFNRWIDVGYWQLILDYSPLPQGRFST